MMTEQGDAAARAQEAIDQLKQAIEENPEAVKQAATDAIASLRATMADLSARQKAELVGTLRDLKDKVSQSNLKQQIDELVAQLNQST
jgi:hypothetical protein